MVLTGNHLPAANDAEGSGCVVGLAVAGCDGAGGHRGRAVARSQREEGAPGGHRDGPRLRGQHRVRHQEEPVGAGGDGHRVRPEPEQPQAARAVPRPRHHHQQHRRAHGRGLHHAGDWRRPLPLERGVPHPVPPEADPGLGRLRRRVAGPDVRAGASARTRRSRRCSSASRTWTRAAAAPTATPAPTRTRSAGRRPTSRCRWCATRAWCSTRCSASAPRPASGASGGWRTRACSTGCPRPWPH